MQRASAVSRSRLAVWWGTLSSPKRRRIVLGSLLALSVAAWNLVLFVAVGSLFALSELAPVNRPTPQAS